LPHGAVELTYKFIGTGHGIVLVKLGLVV